MSNGCSILLSGSVDQQVTAWQANTGDKLASFHTHDKVIQVGLTPDTSKAVCLVDEPKLKLIILDLTIL